MVILDVLLVSTATQIQRKKQDTFKWLHTSYIQLNCQQCSGGSHARQLAAAATMTEAEEFCHCALSLREATLQTPLNHCAMCEYQCESSNINDAGDPSLFALHIIQPSRFHVITGQFVQSMQCWLVPKSSTNV